MPSTLKKTQMIHARIDPKLKKSAERIFTKIGISITEAGRFLSRYRAGNFESL